METYTLSNLRDDISRILPPGEYDIDAITNALHADHGLTHPDNIPEDDFWSTVAEHAIEDINDEQRQQFRTDMTTALADRTMNRIARWTNGVVEVEIVGGSRVRHEFPMPLATVRITPAGGETDNRDGNDVPSWNALWDLVSEATDQTRNAAEQALNAAAAEHSHIKRLEDEARQARHRRDALIQHAHALSLTKYAIAKKLRVAESTIGRIVNP